LLVGVSKRLSVPGHSRLVPDIAMLADPFTGVEIIQTVDGC